MAKSIKVCPECGIAISGGQRALDAHMQIKHAPEPDYRRAILIVQLLARGATANELKRIAMVWGLAVFNDDTRDELLERMAQHAILKVREGQE